MGLSRRIAKSGLIALSGLMKFSNLKRIAGREVYVLNYHSISGVDADPYINRNTYRTVREFEEDVKFCAKNFNIISAVDLIDLVAGNKAFPRDAMVITFDDGLRINYEFQVPVLRKYHATATFFLSSAFVNNSELHFGRKINLILQKIRERNDAGLNIKVADYLATHDLLEGDLFTSINQIRYAMRDHLEAIAELIHVDFQSYLRESTPYLSSVEIEEMLKDGFSIGAHSIDHPRYTELSFDEQVRQTVESMQFILNQFNLDYKLFAFPYSDEQLSHEFYDAIRPHVDLTFGMGGFVDDPIAYSIQRGEVESTKLPIERALKYRLLLSYMHTIFNPHNSGNLRIDN